MNENLDKRGDIDNLKTPRGNIHLILVASVGLALSLLLFIVTRQSEEALALDDFSQAAADRIGVLARDIEFIEYDVELLRSFYEGSEIVHRHEFKDFTAAMLAQDRGIQALEWIPRVPHAKRAEYEAAAREQGFPDFQITERNADGQMVPAATREEYFPVYFIEPYEGNEPALGFDLASNPTRLEALDLSRDTGGMVATARIKLVQETGGQYGFLLFLPVYRKGVETDTVEKRRANLEGFVLGVNRCVDIMAKALTHLKPQGIDVYLCDMTAPPGERLVAFHAARTRTKPTTLVEPDESRLSSGMYRSSILYVGGREWLILCKPTPEFLAAGRKWQPWGVLALGLLFTGLLTAYIGLILNHGVKMHEVALEQIEAKDELARQIAVRECAEDELRRERDLSRILIETAQTIILILDTEGRILRINPYMEEICGYKPEDVIGEDWFETFLPDSDRQRVRSVFMQARGNINTHGTVNPIITKDGKELLIEWYNTTLRDPDGGVIGILSIGYDITQRKRAEEVLQEANKRLEDMNKRLKQNQNQLVQSEKMASIGQLAAGVAHEINNPVGFVKSNLGTLAGYVKTFKELFHHYEILTEAVRNADSRQEQTALDEVERINDEEDLPFILGDIDELLSESIDGTERVRDIVQNLKSFARVDESQIKDTDINEGIEATLKIVWNELKYKCTVNKELNPLPRIRCYPGQLNQVFMNMLVNAAQAIPEKGDINIRTEATDSHIIIQISDTGVGIPEENIPKLFDPFFTTKPKGKGTGLGLSISLGIIQKHNGTIEAGSAVGKGTTFTICLPLEGVSDEG